MAANVDVRIRKHTGEGGQLVKEALALQEQLVKAQLAGYERLKKADDQRLAHHRGTNDKIHQADDALAKASIDLTLHGAKRKQQIAAEHTKFDLEQLRTRERNEKQSDDKRMRLLREDIQKRTAENDREKRKLQKDYQDRVLAHGKASRAITDAEKFSSKTIERLHGLSTKKLINEYKALQDRKQVLLDARERAEGASAKRIVDNKIREIAREQRAYKSVALERGEVLTGGAGAKVGLLGTGRQLISQSGLPGAGLLAKGAFAVGGVAALGMGLKEVISIGMEFEDAMADVAAITGLPKAKIDSLSDSIREQARVFHLDATDAANAYKLIISALGPAVAKSEKAFNSMSKSVMTLAKASGIDASVAADALTTTLNQFGFATADANTQAEQMSRIMNVMAAGSKEGAAEVPHLTEAMKDVGTIAYQAGLSVEETVAILEIFSQAGIKGAEAGTMARNGLLNMQQGSKAAESALKSMGLSFKDINPKVVGLETGLDRLRAGLDKLKTPTERTAALVQIFGERGIAGANIMLKATENAEGLTSAYQKMTAAITGTNTAQEQMDTRMATTSEQWKGLVAEIKDLALTLGQTLLPMIRTTVGMIKGLFDMVSTEATKKRTTTQMGGLSSDLSSIASEAELKRFLQSNNRKQGGQGGEIPAHVYEFYLKQWKAARSNVVTPATTFRGLPISPQLSNTVVTPGGGLFSPTDNTGGGGGEGLSDKEKRKQEKAAKDAFEAEAKKLERIRALKDAELARDIKNSALLEQLKLNNEEQYWNSRLQLAKNKQQKEAIGEAEHNLALLEIRKKILSSAIGITPTPPKIGRSLSDAPKPKDPTTDEFLASLGRDNSGGAKFMDELKSKGETIREGEREEWSRWVDVVGNAFSSAFDVINNGFFTKLDEAFNTSNSIAGAFFGSLIKGLVTMGEQVAIEALKTAILNAIVGGMATATAGTILAAAAPAAMAMSIATLGVASVTGAAAYHTAMASANAIGLSEGGMVPQYFASGGMMGAAQSIRMGGFINKTFFKPRGTDTVPAMLTPGEVVMNKGAVKMLGARNLLSANKQGMRYMAAGGPVGLTSNAQDYINQNRFGGRGGDSTNAQDYINQNKFWTGSGPNAQDYINQNKAYRRGGPSNAQDYINQSLMARQNDIARMAMVNPYTLSGASGGSSAGMSDAQVDRIIRAIQGQPNKVLAPAWEMQTWNQQASVERDIHRL